MTCSLRSYRLLASTPTLNSAVRRSTSSCIMPSRYAPEPHAGSTTVTLSSAAATLGALAGEMPSVSRPSTNAAIAVGSKARFAALQVALQRLTAHERDDRTRRVVRAAVVATGYQLLEHLAQHLWVDGDLDVEGCRLHDGEVEPVEQVGEHRARWPGPARSDRRVRPVRSSGTARR